MKNIYVVLYAEEKAPLWAKGAIGDGFEALSVEAYSAIVSSLAVGQINPQDDVIYALPYTQGQTLAQAVYISGLVRAPALCSGIGRCGLCAIRHEGYWEGYTMATPSVVSDDEAFFSAEALGLGWRLGCRHAARHGEVIQLPASAQLMGAVESNAPLSATSLSACPTPPAVDFLAMDIGTTSVYWQAFARKKGASTENTGSPLPRKRAQDEAVSIALQEPLHQESVEGDAYDASQCGSESQRDFVVQRDKGAQGDKDAQRFSDCVCVGQGRFSNPQMGAGSDVISRIQASLSAQGKKQLADISRHMLACVVNEVGGAQEIYLAANPAMASITLNQDVTSLAASPYALPDAGGEWHSLKGVPPIWVAPHIAPFVGGDISAGYAFLVESGAEFPFLLADMGTNGEFIVALSKDEAYATSVALGPALEGINLTYGSEAKAGVITGFQSSPLGLTPLLYEQIQERARGIGHNRLEGGAPQNVKESLDESQGRVSAGDNSVTQEAIAARMSGTAYIALISQLIDGRALGREGQFIQGGGILGKGLKHDPRWEVAQALLRGEQERYKEKSMESHGMLRRYYEEPFFPLPHNLALFASDVEEILKVKAAFSLGMSRILERVGMPFHELKQVYLAGALGEHVDTEALENLGFFPSGAHERITAVGNAALSGAVCLAKNAHLREWLTAWTKTVTAVNLADDTQFHQQFLEHMVFRF